ncbi:MAG TPA: hypothetical protein VJ914_14085 [Pseudonocardiaceae bacterium]|nr:hypothetical protein [Pseudonocardiaceae bacterium]
MDDLPDETAQEISHGLATLAEDMPTPDIGDIVATARASIRRRRAIAATLLGTVAVVGVLTGTVGRLSDHPPPVPAVRQSSQAPVIDDRAKALDAQLNRVAAELLPSGVVAEPDPANPIRVDGRLLGFEFSTTTDGTGRVYRLDVELHDDVALGALSITVEHASNPQQGVPACRAQFIPCLSNVLSDGTREVVTGGGTQDVEMRAMRPDGTFVDLTYTHLASFDSAAPPSTQELVNSANLLTLATAFTY